GILEHGAETRDASMAVATAPNENVSPLSGKTYTDEQQNAAVADLTAGAMSGDVQAGKAAGSALDALAAMSKNGDSAAVGATREAAALQATGASNAAGEAAQGAPAALSPETLAKVPDEFQPHVDQAAQKLGMSDEQASAALDAAKNPSV